MSHTGIWHNIGNRYFSYIKRELSLYFAFPITPHFHFSLSPKPSPAGLLCFPYLLLT